jgi:hypothetical protein
VQHLNNYWRKTTSRLLSHRRISLSTLASESSSCSTFDTPKTYKWFYIFPRVKPITIAKSQTAFSALPQCHHSVFSNTPWQQARAKGWDQQVRLSGNPEEDPVTWWPRTTRQHLPHWRPPNMLTVKLLHLCILPRKGHT